MSKVNSAPHEKITSIVNPKAARNKWQRRKRLRNYILNHLPGEFIDIFGDKEFTVEEVKKQSQENQTIVAVGGDGTVADVIQGIRESGRGDDILLGLVPFGSGNAFRKSLGIPKNVRKAIHLILNGKVKKIDLIDIEGKTASFVSIGATAQVTQKKNQNKIQGFLGHILASRILMSIKPKEMEIELLDGQNDDGEYFDRKIFNLKLLDCVVGKTSYFGYSWKVAPKAKVDDGFLDITFFETSGWKYMLLFPLIYSGIYQRRQKHFKAKKMIIRGQDLPVQYNGEFLGTEDTFELQVLPQALRIISSE
jgi:diacylglycerol kinase family enzyme